MARRNRALSLTEWEVSSEGAKGKRRNFQTVKCPESIARANNLTDQTYRRIKITCVPIVSNFRITSGKEIYIPASIRCHVETASRLIFELLD